MTRGPIGIIACDSGKPFADRVFQQLKALRDDVHFIPTAEYHFANSEIKTEILTKVRGMDIYVIQDVENSICPKDNDGKPLKNECYSVDENLRALKTAIAAAKICGAAHITAVLPMFPYSRQDKQQAREAISASLVAQEIEIAGADSVITMDIHNLAIAGFFKHAVFINLFGSRDLLKYIKHNLELSNLVVVAPDEGGVKRASFYARELKTKLAIMHKERDYSSVNNVSHVQLLGDVAGRDVLLVDDMVDTAGTLTKAAKTLKFDHKARDIFFATSLPCLNGPALTRLQELYEVGAFKEFIATNAIYHGNLHETYPWFTQIDVTNYFAQVIHSTNTGESVSKLLK